MSEKDLKHQEEFCEFVASCQINRLEILEAMLKLDPRFIVLSREQEIMYQQLQSFLPEEAQGMLRKYEDIANDLAALHETYFYKQGFMDSALFTQTIMGSGRNSKINIKFI